VASRGWRGRGAALAILVALAPVGLLAGCSSSGNTGSSGSTGSGVGGGSAENAQPSGQAVFDEELEHDQKSLDRGVLAYTQINALDVGTQVSFAVKITDIGRTPPPETFVEKFIGWVIDTQDVPTGAIMSVTASCAGVQCEPETTQVRQPVDDLADSDKGTWSWELSAESPGPARITLTATTWLQNTNTPLAVETVPIAIVVQNTAGHQTSTVTKAVTGSVGGVIRWIGSGALLAGIAAVWGWLRKRRQARRAASAAPGPPAGGAAPPAGG
jgi:hypothetical protein